MPTPASPAAGLTEGAVYSGLTLVKRTRKESRRQTPDYDPRPHLGYDIS